MYKNFNLTDEERKTILEQHKQNGYKTSVNENFFDKLTDGFGEGEPSKFSNNDDLLISIKDRLSTAINTQDWGIVSDVLSDVKTSTSEFESDDNYNMPGFGDVMGDIDKLNIR
jgi:hypothetical protein